MGFPTNNIVDTPNGPVQLSALRRGDVVRAIDGRGTAQWSHVIAGINPESGAVQVPLLRISLASQGPLTVSPDHLVSRADGALTFVPAQSLQPGTNVLVLNNSDPARAGMVRARVVRVEPTMGTTLSAPVTSLGTVVVSGVAVSCYGNGSQSHTEAHSAHKAARAAAVQASVAPRRKERLNRIALWAGKTPVTKSVSDEPSSPTRDRRHCVSSQHRRLVPRMGQFLAPPLA